MTFFEGAISYDNIKSMPLPELFRLEKIAAKISSKREREMEKARNGK